jgi:hypothetical protein
MFRLLLPVVTVLTFAVFQTSHSAAQDKVGVMPIGDGPYAQLVNQAAPQQAAPWFSGPYYPPERMSGEQRAAEATRRAQAGGGTDPYHGWHPEDDPRTWERMQQENLNRYYQLQSDQIAQMLQQMLQQELNRQKLPLKIKSWYAAKEMRYSDYKGNANQIRILLEFREDVDANFWKALGFPFGGGPNDPYIEFDYFDDENVRIATLVPKAIIEGDRTGKKGQAFRVLLPTLNDEAFARTKRIEVYLRNPKKKADKAIDAK